VKIHLADPLLDSRWDAFTERHPSASIFHDRGWLRALQRTYGYRPYVITSAATGEPFTNGIVACQISSWMTGIRLVSLPFSDHCQPLVDHANEMEALTDWMIRESGARGWNYVELRPLTAPPGMDAHFQTSGSYWFHELDLEPGIDHLYERLHKNSFQRKIQRAEREGISCESGRSRKLMDEFYGLMANTRRRQMLIPQPRAWFANLLECLGEKVSIRVARKKGNALAAMLTLRHGSTVVYKYGCSDERLHNLGGMPLLFWRLIEESKVSGYVSIDFGRTDMDNPGLLAFKDRLGSAKRLITYYRFTKTAKRGAANLSESRAVRKFVSILPESVSSAAGRLFYKHLG